MYTDIKTYADACKALGAKPISDEVFNAFPEEDRATMAAYHKLTIITRAINEGWLPDWSNPEEKKYEPYMYTDRAGFFSAVAVNAPSAPLTYFGSPLCFRDEERAEFAVNTFGGLYKDFLRPENKKQESHDQTTINDKFWNATEYLKEKKASSEFIKKMGEIADKHIDPLLREDENAGVIIISACDKVKKPDGTGTENTFYVRGDASLLGKALDRFISNKQTEPILDAAMKAHRLQLLSNKINEILKSL